VTDATLMLARLYAEEKTAKGANLPNVGLDRQQDRPGKAAIAKAALEGPKGKRDGWGLTSTVTVCKDVT
jgi:hypothetical protein